MRIHVLEYVYDDEGEEATMNVAMMLSASRLSIETRHRFDEAARNACSASACWSLAMNRVVLRRSYEPVVGRYYSSCRNQQWLQRVTASMTGRRRR